MARSSGDSAAIGSTAAIGSPAAIGSTAAIGSPAAPSTAGGSTPPPLSARTLTAQSPDCGSHRPPTLTQRELTSWRNAVFVIFACCGFAGATWLARTPSVRDLLHASTSGMGLLAFSVAVGSIFGLLSSSHLLALKGPSWTIRLTLIGLGVGLVGAGIGASALHSFPVAAAGLGIFGLSAGLLDVSMNVDGAANERALGRSVMPWFHAWYSAGTIGGAGLGGLAAKLRISVLAEMIAVAVVIAVVGVLAVRKLSPQPDAGGHAGTGAPPGPQGSGWRSRLSAWGEPRTLLIGLVVLGMALAEGSANDWLALSMVDGRGVSNAAGAFLFGLFEAAMTLGRIVGVRLLDRFGRVTVLRTTGVLAVAGLLVVIFVPSLPVIVIGIVIWGFGASLGFPVGMSAASDDPARAGARVSTVSTIGYLAFLGGPPAIGFLGQHVGLLHALLLVLALVAMSVIASPAAREPGRRSSGR